jgi:hypothetical protein
MTTEQAESHILLAIELQTEDHGKHGHSLQN